MSRRDGRDPREIKRLTDASKERHRARHAEEQRLWYARHPNVRRVLSVRDVPCTDCGIELPPQIMELDHVRGEKQFAFGQNTLARPAITSEILEEEIAKCEVRCPNCHRLRHFQSREWRNQLTLEGME